MCNNNDIRTVKNNSSEIALVALVFVIILATEDLWMSACERITLVAYCQHAC